MATEQCSIAHAYTRNCSRHDISRDCCTVDPELYNGDRSGIRDTLPVKD